MDIGQAVESAIQGNKVDLATIAPKTDSVTFVRALVGRFAIETLESRREQIASLARAYLAGRYKIQDREILAGLLQGSATIQDRGTSEAMDLLIGRCDPRILATMPDAILRPLQGDHFEPWLMLVAYAKPAGAQEILQRLAVKHPRLKADGEWMIAMAANGDQTLESSYIKSFLTTDDPSRKEDQAKVLRMIGTRKSLSALAQEMRTPMVYSLGRVFQTPLRETIAIQLSMVFPELGCPFPINSEECYAKVEAFCEKEFGTKWKSKRPPLEHSGPLEHGFQPLPEN
ncbi:MAG: hypothetical protein IPN71_19540 [Fibrobacteres bacterium]|nr:hypothetical protein [Fibrobacterota bacterium]